VIHIPKKVLHLAGYHLAETGLVLSNLNDTDTLGPSSLLLSGDDIIYTEHDAPTLEEALTVGKLFVQKNINYYTAWSLAWECFLNIKGSRCDGINIEFGWKTRTIPTNITYAFTKKSLNNQFYFIGDPILSIGNELVDLTDWECEYSWFLEGVRSHKEASPRWDSWINHGS